MGLHDIKVPPAGPSDAKIYLLGESLGKKEAQQGKAFVGRAGNELDNWLAAVGINRSECRIGNSLPWYPKGKKSHAFFKDGNRGEPTEQFLEGLSDLYHDLLEVQPNVVAAFGNYALWATTGNWGIRNYQGSILESKLVEGQKVVPVIHPAAVLRMYEWKVYALWHMERVKEESVSPKIQLPKRDYIIFPSQKEIDEAVTRLLNAEHFTYDTEWYSPTELACIGFTDSPDWAICIPASHPGALPAYETLLGSDVPKIAQNSMFDVTYLREAGIQVKTVMDSRGSGLDDRGSGSSLINALEHLGLDPTSYNDDVSRILAVGKATRLHEDIMVGHHVCWPDLQNRLERQVCIYTREPYYKDEFKVWEEVKDQEVLRTYNCRDTAVTDEIWDAEQGEMRLCNTGRAYQLTMLTFDIMARATKKGIRADFSKLMHLRDKNFRRAEHLNDLLAQAVGREINVRSWKQVKQLVYGDLGVRERKRKPTAQETLMDVAAQSDDEDVKTILVTIISIRRALNQNSRYTHPCLVDKDGRIRCSWNMAGTVNGRLSSSKDSFKECEEDSGFEGRGAPLQTIPYDVREVFIPDPGHVFLIPDLEQAEARIVAYLSEDWRVIEWLEEDLDIHTQLATLLFDADYNEIIKEKKETGVSRRRYLAKTCRHALNYQMGPRTFKKTINKEFIDTGIGVTASEAKSLRNKYLTIHSPLKVWWKKIKRELRHDQQRLTSPLGRTRKFLGRWGGVLFRDATAFKPQSTIGDLNHLGLFEVDRRLPYAEVLVNIHDGSLIQVPEDKVEEAAPVVQDALSIPITVNGHNITIPVEVKIGYDWKNAETYAV